MDDMLDDVLVGGNLPLPHTIPPIYESDEELPLPLVPPNLQIQDLANAPVPDQNPVRQNEVAGPIQRRGPFVTLLAQWPVYSGMNYIGVDEELLEEWAAAHEVEQEQEINLEDEIMDKKVFDAGPLDSLTSKHRDAVTDETRLLEDINPTMHIATLGLRELPMPDATPAFAPTLEPRPHQ